MAIALAAQRKTKVRQTCGRRFDKHVNEGSTKVRRRFEKIPGLQPRTQENVRD